MSMQPPPVLTGSIIYRLELSEDSSDWSSSKKKRSRNDLAPETEHEQNSLRRTGFFLVAQDGAAFDEYLLVIPQNLLKKVCDAVRFKYSVQVTKYSLSSMANLVARRPQHEQVSVSVLEISSDGLTVFQSTSTQEVTPKESILSLPEFRALEQSFGDQKDLGKPSSFTIRATVDAISPIIAAVPSDPFALMELYQAGSCESCIVVVKGAKALACHAGIQPGDSVTLQNVKRQKWHVPSWFNNKGAARLASRAPKYVFVVTNPLSIVWLDDESLLPPLPSTVVPLVSVEGVVDSIETRPWGPGDTNVVYCLRLCQTDNGGSLQKEATHTLYLSQYPMPPELLMGLRPGAVLRAVNVHPLPFENPHVEGGIFNYGACLRSTVTLIECAGEKDDGDDLTLSRGAMRENSISVTHVRPLVFGEIRKSYMENEFRWYLEYCKIKTRIEGMWPSKQHQCDKPLSFDEIETIMLQHCTESPTVKKKPQNIPNSNETNKQRKHKRKRDPYAEFFDHACEEESESTDKNDLVSDCNLSRDTTKNLVLPALVGLGDIRNICVDRLKERLKCLVHGEKDIASNQSIQGGWTSSFALGPDDLLKGAESSVSLNQHTFEQNVDYEQAERRMVVCASVSAVGQDERPSILEDSECHLPVCCNCLSPPETKQATPILVDVNTAIISCLCLGASATQIAETTSETTSTFACVELPYLPSDGPAKERKGSCTLLEYRGLLFIASVQVQCGFLTIVGGASTSNALSGKSAALDYFEKSLKAKRISSIHECLRRDEMMVKHKSQYFSGLLVRERLRFVKMRNGSFMGCVLTVSHVPDSCRLDCYDETPQISALRVSTIQSIEVKLSIPCPKRRLDILQKNIRKLLGEAAITILKEQSDLAAAWWIVSDSGTASALVVNGLDDLKTVSQTLPVPMAVIPCSAISVGSHGYLRFQCSLNDITSSFLRVTDDSHSHNMVTGPHLKWLFDAVGGIKFFPGSLDRRPRRRLLYDHVSGNDSSCQSRRCTGEMLAVPNDVDCGVSALSLADLHWKICADMRNRSQTELAPSMVRVIRNATLLSLSFCRALAECTKCFQSLKSKRAHIGSNRPVSGVVSFVQETKEKTYWHVPFPMVGNQGKTAEMATSAQKPTREDPRSCTSLVCPNGCSLEHARIKWECSGLLDDGSGQAKLYAERETALSLLGSGLRVNDIEAGAWCVEGGILFQNNVPPKSFVKQAVLEAQSMAQREMNRLPKTKRQRLANDDVVKYLTVEARAEYYMQQHCRQSSEPTRSLDYYVRCKPLSNEAIHLNQTQVEMAVPPVRDYMQASTMNVTTYSLPPLKLSLVDCSVPKYEAFGNTDSSWDLVRAMTDD
jgi:hypothetical protein